MQKPIDEFARALIPMRRSLRKSITEYVVRRLFDRAKDDTRLVVICRGRCHLARKIFRDGKRRIPRCLLGGRLRVLPLVLAGRQNPPAPPRQFSGTRSSLPRFYHSLVNAGVVRCADHSLLNGPRLKCTNLLRWLAKPSRSGGWPADCTARSQLFEARWLRSDFNCRRTLSRCAE